MIRLDDGADESISVMFSPSNVAISASFRSLPRHTWMNKFPMKTLSNGKMVYVIDIVSFAVDYNESRMEFCNGIILYGCTNNHNYASYLQLSSCPFLLPRQFPFFMAVHRPKVRYFRKGLLFGWRRHISSAVAWLKIYDVATR